mmetsp:Transcript_21722/g.31608  ORF Transcript_21722/g.31608 Transcript_21722/m.31608 type:complete len:393 (+) Transcript_21722:30-1208(+)
MSFVRKKYVTPGHSAQNPQRGDHGEVEEEEGADEDYRVKQTETIQFLLGLLEKAAAERDQHLSEISDLKSSLQRLSRKSELEEKAFRRVLTEERARFDKRVLRNKNMIQRRDELLCEWAEIGVRVGMDGDNRVTQVLQKTCELLPSARSKSTKHFLRTIQEEEEEEEEYSEGESSEHVQSTNQETRDVTSDRAHLSRQSPSLHPSTNSLAAPADERHHPGDASVSLGMPSISLDASSVNSHSKDHDHESISMGLGSLLNLHDPATTEQQSEHTPSNKQNQHPASTSLYHISSTSNATASTTSKVKGKGGKGAKKPKKRGIVGSSSQSDVQSSSPSRSKYSEVSAALGVSSTGISGIKDAGYTVVESTSSVDSTHKNKKYWYNKAACIYMLWL